MMQFGPGTTVTHTPTSPAGEDYDGVVNEAGELEVDGKVYTLNAGPPENYRHQAPGNPPGGWTVIEYADDGSFEVTEYDPAMLNGVPVQVGTYTAVA